MQELTSTFMSRLRFPTISPRLRMQPRSLVRTTVCMNQTRKEKVVVIMGATGTGKSRLSVDLATRFSGEIINSDKIQVYKGLEIATNQITIPEQCGIPHHLIGELPPDSELAASEFRTLASRSISEIASRGKLPIIAGGSNSFVYALLVDHYNRETNPFASGSLISSELRYDCCFLWVDVSVSVLFHYLSKRVDQMMESGMFEELAGFYNPIDSSKMASTGIRKSIGVPEFDRYFEVYPPEKNGKMCEWDPERKAAYEEAVQAIKDNTWLLAKKQVERIMMLRSSGWEIQRLDATSSLRASSRDVWEKNVSEESVNIVKRFLLKD